MAVVSLPQTLILGEEEDERRGGYISEEEETRSRKCMLLGPMRCRSLVHSFLKRQLWQPYTLQSFYGSLT